MKINDVVNGNDVMRQWRVKSNDVMSGNEVVNSNGVIN